MVSPRDYQQRSVNEIWAWLSANQTGHPVAVLPTGAGKSIICAVLVREALKCAPAGHVRVLVATHSKELVEQNYEKHCLVSPEIEGGIYAASIGRKELEPAVVFASIQSIARAPDLPAYNLLIIDECHRVPPDGGQYNKLIERLLEKNPKLRVIGLTATPFRLDQGYIYGGDNLFSEVATEVTIPELIEQGYLSKVISCKTAAVANMKGVRKVGGDYQQAEAAERMMDLSEVAVADAVVRGRDRKSWLFFCVTVDHARQVRDLLKSHGITAEMVSGKTSKANRADIIRRFKAGEIQALVNCEVLTTGFDAPSVDLIGMLRPTASTALYMQITGRGMRIAPGKFDCLILDYAGNIQRHGCIDDPSITVKKKGKGDGQAPVKDCPKCQIFVPISTKVCPECEFEFPIDSTPKLEKRASNRALLKADLQPILVKYDIIAASYHAHKKPNRPPTMRVTYSGHETGSTGFNTLFPSEVCSEWISVEGDGYARKKAEEWWHRWSKAPFTPDVDYCVSVKQKEGIHPTQIVVDIAGKYPRILERI
ncbi:MAG: DEAD/DEAH box helicase family protein [Photobacterium halotolerans]